MAAALLGLASFAAGLFVLGAGLHRVVWLAAGADWAAAATGLYGGLVLLGLGVVFMAAADP